MSYSTTIVWWENNHQYWSRNLGRIVRDCNIYPLQVYSEKDIGESEKRHMLGVVKGGKDSQPPDMDVIFYEARKKNRKLIGENATNKYDEPVKTIQSKPSLSNIEVVEECFGPQRHGHVYGYGGGVKWKTFNESKSAYIKELEARLHEKEEENRNLKRRMDGIESRLDRIENGSSEPSSSGNTTSNDLHQVATLLVKSAHNELRVQVFDK